MSEKVNPWFPPVPASVLLPPATAGSSAPPPDPPDPPDPLSPSSPSFDFQFPTLQTTVASPPLSKKQISLLKGTASFGSGNGKSSLLLCSSSGPDEVFQRGAELHKDFVLGSFLAKMPSYQAIQSVLNFMWGKGQKLDIRTNKEKRTIMVRIPNAYIRKKVLEKRIWYVGTAMFQVTPWSSRGSVSAVDIGSIPLWAHLNGLPLDLRTLEGLSFAAGLIGEPKETDEFTKNISDVNIAHVKVEADMTKPLPTLIELRRTSGEIIPVHVEYPWTPPVCSFFNLLALTK